MPDWFEENAPPAPTSGDWFGKNSPQQQNDDKPGALSTFLSAAGSRLNPLNMIKGAGETLSNFAEHPIDSMISNSPVGAIQRAKEAYDRGDMREAVVHLGSAFMPGPPVEEQTGVKLAHGQYAEGFGDLAGDVAAALIPMGISKAGTALRGSEAAGFARDVLAHPKVTTAIKNAVKDSIKQGLREVPGVKTIETVGKGAVTAKGVIDDVRAARNAPAAPQPSRIIQAGPMERLNARTSVPSEGNVPSTPGPVDAGPPAAEAPPVTAAQPEPIESSLGIVKPRLTVDPAEVQAISAASPEPAVSPAASPEAAAAAEPIASPATSADVRSPDPIATPADEVPRPEIQRSPVTTKPNAAQAARALSEEMGLGSRGGVTGPNDLETAKAAAQATGKPVIEQPGYEMAGRAEKSQAVAKYLHEQGVTVDQLKPLSVSDEFWKTAAKAAGQKEPSGATVVEIRQRLAKLEKVAPIAKGLQRELGTQDLPSLQRAVSPPDEPSSGPAPRRGAKPKAPRGTPTANKIGDQLLR